MDSRLVLISFVGYALLFVLALFLAYQAVAAEVLVSGIIATVLFVVAIIGGVLTGLIMMEEGGLGLVAFFVYAGVAAICFTAYATRIGVVLGWW